MDLIKKTQDFFRVTRYLIWAYRTGYFLEKGYYKYGIHRLKIKALKKLGFLRLERIFLCPSYQCNANCPHCYEKFQFEKDKSSLTTEECKIIIDQFKELGGYFVSFVSGEFIMRADALELIKYCSDKRMVVEVTSNGILLDEKMIDDLKNAGLTILAVSIDSADPNIHDKYRGEGVFAKAANGLKLAKEKGLKTQIWTYISASNNNELDDIGELGKSLGVDFVLVFFSILAGNLFYKSEEMLSFEQREGIRNKYFGKYPILLHHGQESWPCDCGGRELICVKPTGDVTFCPVSPYSYGSIRQKTLKELLGVVEKDCKKFSHCTGQCIVNFKEYRENCNAKFMYPPK